MIGGTDVVLAVSADIPVNDVVFRTVRRHWPNFVFQDADDESGPFARDDGSWPPLAESREFFIYKNEKAARSWEEHGAIRKNFNTMLYVILGDKLPLAPNLMSMTLVCGAPTGKMQSLIQDLKNGLQDVSFASSPPFESEAA